MNFFYASHCNSLGSLPLSSWPFNQIVFDGNFSTLGLVHALENKMAHWQYSLSPSYMAGSLFCWQHRLVCIGALKAYPFPPTPLRQTRTPIHNNTLAESVLNRTCLKQMFYLLCMVHEPQQKTLFAPKLLSADNATAGLQHADMYTSVWWCAVIHL